MKRLFQNLLLITAVFSITFLISCNDDEGTITEEPTDFDYHAHIMSPNADTKNVGDNIHIHVNFESHTGEVVHHVQVTIYSKSDNTVIYTGLSDAHVHAMNGSYEFHDDFVLSDAVGVTGHSDWVLEAKVWGHEAGMAEEIETVEFHVHP